MRPQRVNINYSVVVVVIVIIIIIIIISLPPLPKYEDSKGRVMVSVMWAMVIVYRTVVSILLGCDRMFSCKKLLAPCLG
jgi:high-affinity K+ transport system ATPase subunit B